MYITRAVETIRDDIIRSLELKIDVKLEMRKPSTYLVNSEFSLHD